MSNITIKKDEQNTEDCQTAKATESAVTEIAGAIWNGRVSILIPDETVKMTLAEAEGIAPEGSDVVKDKEFIILGRNNENNEEFWKTFAGSETIVCKKGFLTEECLEIYIVKVGSEPFKICASDRPLAKDELRTVAQKCIEKNNMEKDSIVVILHLSDDSEGTPVWIRRTSETEMQQKMPLRKEEQAKRLLLLPWALRMARGDIRFS